MKNTPKLRFKEFSGEWESRRFKDIIKETRLGGNYANTGNKTDYPLIKMGNIARGKIDLSKIEYIPEEEAINNDDILKHGDLLFNTRNTLDLVGKVSVWRNELDLAYYNSNLMKLVFDEKFIDNNYFMNYLFNTRTVLSRLKAIATGTTSVAAIYTRDLQNIKLEYPCLEEQEKIASLFSLIDDKISLQGDKVEALKDYKKGMMQKIFSRELRFKDDEGRDYPDWEKIKMGDITVKVGPKNKDNYNYEVYSINNKVGFIPQNEQFEGSRLDSLDKSLYKIVNKGEFAYNPARINVGSIGVLEEDKTVIVSSLYVCFKLVENMDYRFFNQYFSYPEFNKSVIRNTEGSVREYLFYENFSCIKMYIPCLEEQIKIADCLTTLDKKLEKEEEKLERLNEYKKGLLQQMFI
ncbi:MAG: restriction endonuclease subunit S [Paraclostridium sp.]